MIKNLKFDTLFKLKSYWFNYLGFILLLLFFNMAKVKSETVPLDYDFPDNDVSNTETLPDQRNIEENNHNLDQENREILDEPIMIFVPPPDSNREININYPRKSLADLLIIEEMLIPF